MQDKKIGVEDKEAVSPVIGVILMVAVTVLLSSIVGVIVLGLGGQVNRNVQAGVDIDFEKDDDEVRVVFVQNRNAEYINVTLTGWGSEITVRMQKVGSVVITNNDTVRVLGNGRVFDLPNDAVQSLGPPGGAPGGPPGGGPGGPPPGVSPGPPKMGQLNGNGPSDGDKVTVIVTGYSGSGSPGTVVLQDSGEI